MRMFIVVMGIVAYLGCSSGEQASTGSAATSETAGGDSAQERPSDSSGLIGQDVAPAGDKSGPKASPWGTPDDQQGAPLPPRPSMNSAASRAYQQGLAAMSEYNDAQAAKAFRRALDEDSKAYLAAYHLGLLADRAGDSNRALEHYHHALRIQPDYERAVAGIIAVNVRRGTINEALTFVEELAKKWERNLRLQVVYSHALIQAKQLDRAEQVAISALRRDERYVPAMLAIADASFARGRLELAESILDQALKIDPKHPEALYLMGKLHAEQGKLAEALDSYRKATDARPDYAEARVALGIQLLAGGNYQEALKEFEAANRLSPPEPEVLLNLGDAYRATRQWEKSRQALEKALSLKPDLAEAHFNLGLLYMSAGNGLKGLTTLQALQKAVQEFGSYRSLKAGRLGKSDASQSYLEDLDRQIQREKRRLEREARNAAQGDKPAATDKPAEPATKEAK